MKTDQSYNLKNLNVEKLNYYIIMLNNCRQDIKNKIEQLDNEKEGQKLQPEKFDKIQSYNLQLNRKYTETTEFMRKTTIMTRFQKKNKS